MADAVYSSTTVTNPKSSWFLVPSDLLDWTRFIVKGLEVLLSLVAFVQEEVINECFSCASLYFFEFMSCTAFLFTLLLLILLTTPLHQRVGVTCWSKLDFCYTATIFVLFFISSIIFSASHSGSAIEKSAVAFGFLASGLFLVDLFLFFRSYGFPFTLDQTQENPANGPTGQSAPSGVPEAEKLTNNGA